MSGQVSACQKKLNQHAYRNSEAGGHSIEVIGMLAHGHDLRYDGVVGPLNTKHLGEFLQVLG